MNGLVVLFLMVLLQDIGNICLSRGMHLVGQMSAGHSAVWIAIGVHGLANPWVVLGVAFLIAHFFFYLKALSKFELSYILPMTALSYLSTALLSLWMLGETISASRWLGIGVICVGIFFVGLSERQKMEPAQ